MPIDPNLGSASDQVGSPNNGPANAGQPGDGTDYKALYEGLESKLGSMGNELGEYRNFFQGISPLLEKLDKSPELVQAIVDGKVDQDLAKAVMEGKVTIGEAEAVTKAHTEVKKDLGTKGYAAADSEQIAKLVEEKVNEVRKDLSKDLKEVEEIRSFEASVNEFVANTPDFPKYAEAISSWIDEHDTTDIRVAYYAVKGEAAERAEKEKAEKEAGEYQKGQVPAAGQSGSYYIPEGNEVVDKLIAGKSNPNVF